VFLVGITWFAAEYLSQYRIDMLNDRHVNFYFWMFTGGCLACLLYEWPALRRRVDGKLGGYVFGAISALTILLIFLSSNELIDHLWRPLIPSLPEGLVLNGWGMPGVWFFLFLCLLYGLSMFPETLAGRLLQSRFFRHLGLLSYSLYLFHVPVMLQLKNCGFRERKRTAVHRRICNHVRHSLSFLFDDRKAVLDAQAQKAGSLIGKGHCGRGGGAAIVVTRRPRARSPE
jgi:peptidoglycan/LPS O-acetylase OafA/YrhL